MNSDPASPFSKLRLFAVAMLFMAVAACAAPFQADVSRFRTQLPAPAGETFAVVADNPKLVGGLEFAQYAGLVSEHLAKLGYTPVQNPAQASMIVRFNYSIDDGHERVRSNPSPYFGPWYGYSRFGRFGGFGGWGGPWRYGWYDPFFDGGVQSYTVYTSKISLKIDRAADGQRLFEGRAEAASSSNRLQYLVPNLVDAMFTNFPGNSGETVRITVAPEKKN